MNRRLSQLLLACCLALSTLLAGRAMAHPGPTVEVFVREGCPRCAAAKDYLEELRAARPDVRIRYRWVDRDADARAELMTRSAEAGIAAPGVPTFVVGDQLLVGFQSPETTGRELEALLARAPPSPAAPPAAGACELDETDCETLEPSDEVTTAVGRVSVSRLGLPLFTIVLGLLDGFNPCAMWVLLFLLSMLVNLRDRRRMALVAAAFVLISGAVYFAFMAAWLNVFLLIGFSRAIQVVLGVVALAIGALNVRDFYTFKQGASLSIPDSAKPGIYARVRRILRARTFTALLAGVAVLAVLVNFVELLCTAGLPAVYTAVLSRQELSAPAYYGYLLLYNLAYILDDGLMVTLAVVTLSRRKLTERAGRWLKLVSGVVMLFLGGALLLAPEVLL